MKIIPLKINKISDGGKKKTYWGKIIFLVAMMIVPIINWLVFWLYVNFSSIMLAFQDQRTGIFTFNNFVDFWQSLTVENGGLKLAITNTFIYFLVGNLLILPLSLFISYFLYKRIMGYRFFRIVFYLPAIISSVAMVASYTAFIAPNGPFSQMCSWVGINLPKYGLLFTVKTATPSIIVFNIWTGFCGNILLFNGSMSRVPFDVIESARLDGIKPFKEIFYIIIPLIWPTLSTMLIFAFTGIFGASGPILLFHPGGEYNTTTLSFWIFLQVYGNGQLGGTGNYNLVSCTGLCFTTIGVPLILLVRWLIEKVPSVEY